MINSCWWPHSGLNPAGSSLQFPLATDEEPPYLDREIRGEGEGELLNCDLCHMMTYHLIHCVCEWPCHLAKNTQLILTCLLLAEPGAK